MKFSPLIFFLIFFCACANNKKGVTPTNSSNETEEIKENYRVVGVIHLDTSSCGIFLQTEVKPDEFINIFPINLDATFKQDGTRIKFEYTRSRMQVPEDCNADFAAKVYEVSRVR